MVKTICSFIIAPNIKAFYKKGSFGHAKIIFDLFLIYFKGSQMPRTHYRTIKKKKKSHTFFSNSSYFFSEGMKTIQTIKIVIVF